MIKKILVKFKEFWQRKTIGAAILQYAMIVLVLAGLSYLYWEWKEQEKMLQGTLPTSGPYNPGIPPAQNSL